MKVQVLGTGCPKCVKLAENVNAAVAAANVECEVEKVTDINAIISMGVMMTPALVVDGRTKSVGKVPTVDEIQAMLV